jgi:hypothetical protein
MGERRNAYGDMMGTPGRKRPLGSSRHRWKDYIKKDLREIKWGVMDWIIMAQVRYQWGLL